MDKRKSVYTLVRFVKQVFRVSIQIFYVMVLIIIHVLSYTNTIVVVVVVVVVINISANTITVIPTTIPQLWLPAY